MSARILVADDESDLEEPDYPQGALRQSRGS